MQSYSPSEEAARLAPACVCNVASRVVWLRQIVKEFPLDIQAKLKRFTDPLPFEKELMSGKMDEVERAIIEIGKLQTEDLCD